MFDANNFQDHYSQVRARLSQQAPKPKIAIPPAKPKPVEVTPQRNDEELDQEVQKLQSLLDGCVMPKRLKMLIIPIIHDHGFSWKELVSISRKKYLHPARREIWIALREEGNLSFPQIGKLLNRDHSTIVHGYNGAKNA